MKILSLLCLIGCCGLNFVSSECTDSCNNLEDQCAVDACGESSCVLDCVRDIFCKKGKDCDVQSGDGICNSFTISSIAGWYPYFQVYAKYSDVNILGINSAEVKCVIVDDDTCKTVITIDYCNIIISAKAEFTLVASCKDPITVSTDFTITFPDLTLVTEFPTTKDLDITESQTVAIINKPPTIDLGDCVTDSNNDEIQDFNKAVCSNPTLFGADTLFTIAPAIQDYVIQQLICYYKLDVCLAPISGGGGGGGGGGHIVHLLAGLGL